MRLRSRLTRPTRALLTFAILTVGLATISSAAGAQAAIGETSASAPNTAASARLATAVRTDSPPQIDGNPHDLVWQTAPMIDGFLEYEPVEGARTQFNTMAHVLYDDRNLYVLVRMYDPAPDSMVSLLARRDERVASEQLKIVIDSYHDRRTAYQFAVNPAGVKRDFYVYNDNVEDPSWDSVWDVGTSMDSTGWFAEFRIPFSQLRYENRPNHTFGLMIVRDVARSGQRISWPLFRRSVQGYVSQSGELHGISGIPAPRRLEMVPYVVTQNVTRATETGFSHPQHTTAGLDLKYGLSPNVTLDATINPDFGQVEADPAVLNLTAFEQFFSERRPFFIEGTGIFDYRVQCDDIDNGCTGLLYSRRIGRAPQLLNQYGTASSPTSTTILGAAKLSGRVGNGLSIGLLEAVTGEETGSLGRAIEPRSNYLVARARQELNGGNSDVGAIFTSVHRDMSDAVDPLLRSTAYTGGLDMRHRFGSNHSYELAASVTGSIVEGSAEAIARTQMDGVHNYQRSDGRRFDPDRTRLTGDAQRISISKFGGGRTRFQTVYQRFSPGFEINDLGFLSRADDQLFRNWFALRFDRPNSFQQRSGLNFNAWGNWNAAGMPTQRGLNFNSHMLLRNFMWVYTGTTVNGLGAVYDDRASRGGPAVRRSVSYSAWAGVEGDNRRTIVPVFFAGFGGADEGHGSDWYVEPSIRYRAGSRLSGSLGARWSEVRNDDQWRANFGDPHSDTTHHTFARLEQTTLSLTARLNYTFTPSLTLQFYAQPFVSTGTYSNWRELNDPRAASYADRYQPFTGEGDPGGFRFMQFRSNTVLRWEYRPGSAIFLVWSQGRQRADEGPYELDFSRDGRDLFGAHPGNTFLLKASWWLGG